MLFAYAEKDAYITYASNQDFHYDIASEKLRIVARENNLSFRMNEVELIPSQYNSVNGIQSADIDKILVFSAAEEEYGDIQFSINYGMHYFRMDTGGTGAVPTRLRTYPGGFDIKNCRDGSLYISAVSASNSNSFPNNLSVLLTDGCYAKIMKAHTVLNVETDTLSFESREDNIGFCFEINGEYTLLFSPIPPYIVGQNKNA